VSEGNLSWRNLSKQNCRYHHVWAPEIIFLFKTDPFTANQQCRTW
jgi:hypothetical protein